MRCILFGLLSPTQFSSIQSWKAEHPCCSLVWKIMEAALVSVATGVLSSVIPKLAALLGEEYKLQKRVRSDIMFLEAELERLRKFLQKRSEAGDPGVREKTLMRQVRELSYDIEDSIDAFMVRGGREPAWPQSLKGCIRRIKKTRSPIAVEIHNLKSAVQEMSKRCSRYNLEGVASSVSTVPEDPRIGALYAEVSSLVGVDGPRDELVKLLMEEESESAARLKVISVVGLGGVGKTTLANEVYRTTEAYFDCRAWVSVSRNPSMKKILMDILRQVQGPHRSEDEGIWDERNLIRKINESLQHKRYLIVVDDIWSTETWEIIKCALPLNTFGGRIITTTRNFSVAESCCSHWNDHVYMIKPLSSKESRMLFHRRTFGSEGRCPAHLVEVSDNILRKCSGLPLAITIISGLLASKPDTKEEWMSVYDSIGATLETNNTLQTMQSILALSYSDLPHHLKACLLYLSIFPRDYVIDRDRILRMWIAEGLVLGEHKRTPEEVGESYFNELINRNMIQPVHVSYDDQPKACIIHDMMLDFITCMSEEENFVTLLGDEERLSVSRKIRRLSIMNIKETHNIPASMAQSHIRSLTIFGNVGRELPFQDLALLRVLDLEGCTDLKNDNIKDIVELLHLRYLSIRDTPISELPAQIGGLCFLTTLDLRGTELRELPSTIVRLQRLTYLLCDKMRFPEGIGRMKALSVLSQFDILQSEIFVVEELGDLSELRELVIWWSLEIEFSSTERYERLAFSLYRLNKLHSLCIHGSDSSVDFLDHLRHPLRELHSIQLNSRCYLSRIPEWFRSLPSLSYVCIDVKEVKNEDLQLLSELPSLRHLSLSSKSMATEKLVIGSHGFPVLREFQLHSARADLTFEAHAMEKLERLLLSFHVLTEETYGFSFSVEHLMNLKKIDIRINREGADASQFEAAEVAIRKAAENHPNHPMHNIVILGNLADDAAKEEKEKA